MVFVSVVLDHSVNRRRGLQLRGAAEMLAFLIHFASSEFEAMAPRLSTRPEFEASAPWGILLVKSRYGYSQLSS